MAREVKTSGRTVYLPDRDEWEETPTEPRLPPGALEAMIRAKVAEAELATDPAPRAGPYALGFARARGCVFDVSGFVEHELRCSGCGERKPDKYPDVVSAGSTHYVPAPGGWRKCGEWR